MDRAKQLLVDALRGGVDRAELRLYRAGKLPGLFNGKTTANTDLARQAVAEGLIEIVRAEVKGKAPVEFVRVTAKGVEFVVSADSPVRALEELKAVLDLNREGVPAWLAELRAQVDAVGQRFLAEVDDLGQRLEAMSLRVNEALRRVEKFGPPVPEGAAGALPWAHDAIEYLDRRGQSGLGERCALPELFSHLAAREDELTIRDFHTGLRRLHDRGLVRLFPADDNDGPAEPEYALLDGANVFYFAAKAA
jgi:DNA-binding PadR family transcriptional regulator